MKRPILYICVSFSIGIGCAYFLDVQPVWPLISGGVFLAASFFLSRKNVLSHLAMYAAIISIGISYYQNFAPPSPGFLADHPVNVCVKGTIADDPVFGKTVYNKDRLVFTLKTDSYKDGVSWRGTKGLVRVNLYADPKRAWVYGDEVVLEGLASKNKSVKNFGIFDYAEYLRIKGVHGVISVKERSLAESLGKNRGNPIVKCGYALRHKLRAIVDANFASEPGEFLKAIMIGDRALLSEDVTDEFVKTGTVHIIAISGLNLVMIAGIVLAFLGILKVPKRVSLIMTLVFLIIYSFATGANPPIVRALIMFAVVVIGYLMQREADALNSLSLAALLMLLWRPSELFDPSFQLSFASIASMLIFTPAIEEMLNINTVGRDSFLGKATIYIGKGVSVSLAAVLGVSPIVAHYFNIVSVMALLANLIIIPFLSALTASALAFFLIAFFSNFLAQMFAHAITAMEAALFSINGFMAAIPFGYFRSSSPSLYFLVAYYALISVLLTQRRLVATAWNRIGKKKIFIALLLCLNIIVWKTNLSFEGKQLKIAFLDVGQGDSSFIEFPGGLSMLIDGGSGGLKGLDAGRSVVAPHIWNSRVSKIDAVVVTHFHEDHLGGLIYILKNFTVGCVIDRGEPARSSALYNEYKRIIRQRHIRRLKARDGDLIQGFGEAKVFVLNPPRGPLSSEENENSLVIKLVDRNFSAIFCGDITDKTMERLNERGAFLKSDIMKIPHHGSGAGKDQIVKNILEKISPKLSVISRGPYGIYGSGYDKIYNIITSLGSICYVTSESGEVDVFFGPNSYYVKAAIDNKN